MAYGAAICEDCRKRPPLFVRAASAVRYGGTAASLLARWKRGGDHALVPTLTELAHEALKRLDPGGTGPRFDVIVPVPSHPERVAARGFCATDLLAEELGRVECVAVRSRWLARVRLSAPQGAAGTASRRANVEGAATPAS